MLTKNTTAVKVKAGPEDGLAEGEFVVYPSTFTREPDAVNDVVAPGAFLKSLDKWAKSGNVLPGLYGHRTDDPDFYVASALETGEDEHGWWVKGAFDMDSPKGPQVYRLVKGRRLNQLSFAYDVIDQAEVELEHGVKANELRELEVYEFSFVPVGANQDTGVVAVKAIVENVERELKAGRTLSAKNETELRKAHESIGNVLDSLDGKRGNPYHDTRGRFSHGVDAGTEVAPADPAAAGAARIAEDYPDSFSAYSDGDLMDIVRRHPDHMQARQELWDRADSDQEYGHGGGMAAELERRGIDRPEKRTTIDAGKASGNDPSRHAPAPPASRVASLSPPVATALLEADLAMSA